MAETGWRRGGADSGRRIGLRVRLGSGELSLADPMGPPPSVVTGRGNGPKGTPGLLGLSTEPPDSLLAGLIGLPASVERIPQGPLTLFEALWVGQPNQCIPPLGPSGPLRVSHYRDGHFPMGGRGPRRAICMVEISCAHDLPKSLS